MHKEHVILYPALSPNGRLFTGCSGGAVALEAHVHNLLHEVRVPPPGTLQAFECVGQRRLLYAPAPLELPLLLVSPLRPCAPGPAPAPAPGEPFLPLELPLPLEMYLFLAVLLLCPYGAAPDSCRFHLCENLLRLDGRR